MGASMVTEAVAGEVVAIESVAGSLGCRGVIWSAGSSGDSLSTAAMPPKAKVLRPLRLLVEPVVEAALRLVNPDGEPIRAGPSLLAALAHELRMLTRVDPLAKAWREETRTAGGAAGGKSGGRWILAGAGELHLDVSARSLSAAMGEGIEVALEPPSVQYRETVRPEDETVLKVEAECPRLPISPSLGLRFGARFAEKSPNGHNRFEVAVAALPSAWLKALSQLAHGRIDLPETDDSEVGGKASASAWPSDGARVVARLLGWPAVDARRVWAIGPGSVRREDVMGTVGSSSRARGAIISSGAD